MDEADKWQRLSDGVKTYLISVNKFYQKKQKRLRRGDNNT